MGFVTSSAARLFFGRCIEKCSNNVYLVLDCARTDSEYDILPIHSIYRNTLFPKRHRCELTVHELAGFAHYLLRL
jgi:hypothetical protein